MWTYRAKVIRVVDGDTVDVDIDLGFGIWQKNERVRIMGIDTPESRTRDKVEKQFADTEVPRPSHWGGYKVRPITIEFWQGKRDRLHDRFRFQKTQDTWSVDRLAP